MSQPVPWLPDACLKSERATRQMNELVADWSRRWIVREGWRAVASWSEAGDADDGTWSPLRTAGRATIEGAPGAVVRLALAMLGADDGPGNTPRDHKFLRRLAGHALDDLASRADALVPAAGGAAGCWADTPWSLRVGAVGEPLIRISIGRADLCQLARQAFPRDGAGSLFSRSSAVAEMPLSIAAHLGTATMDIAQFDALEPGDVIVLDRRLSTPATLMVAGLQTPLPCTLSQLDESLVLELVHPA